MKSVTIVVEYSCDVSESASVSQIQEQMREKLESNAEWFVLDIQNEDVDVELKDVSAGTQVMLAIGGE